MKIRLDPEVDRPIEWQETLSLAASELDYPDLAALGEVRCRGRISPLAPGFLLEANLSYVQTLYCNRCLEPYELPTAIDVKLMLDVREEDELPEELELEAEDLDVLVLAEPELETRPLWIEQLHLAIPMKPLCKDDCAGLCSGCGTDLNKGSCSCAEAAVDPRWAALAGLKTSH